MTTNGDLASRVEFLEALHSNNVLTVAAALVLFEVARREQAGESTVLTDVAHALDMPLSSCSRIAWELASEHKLVDYRDVEGDRRMKALTVNAKRFERLNGNAVAA